MSISLRIGRDGSIAMLHHDAVDLSEFGDAKITRASHVEFDNQKQCWYVQSAKTGTVLKDDFTSRAEALAWEAEYYSPSGPGWLELEVS